MKIITPATSANLGPGFDCLGLSLALFNEVQIKASKEQIIEIFKEGAKDKALFTDNLFVQIFKQTYAKLDGKKANFHFRFQNNIPFSRGLGSSSAVIVGALAAAYHKAGVKISKEELLNEALKYENHPDNIAPATLGGFVCSLVEKGKVFSIKKEMPHFLKALIIVPDTRLDTKHSRSLLPKNISFKTGVFNVAHSSFLTACFLEQKFELLALASKDKLHQIRRMKNLPLLFEVQKLALENGALMSVLSGSGSSFFSLVYVDDAKRISAKMQEKFSNFECKVLEFDNNGFEIC